jgi:hypothetical protein
MDRRPAYFVENDKMSRTLVGAALVLALWPTPPAPAQSGGRSGRGPAVGAPAPEIEGEDLFGRTFSLSEYRGRVVVLAFWGNW